MVEFLVLVDASVTRKNDLSWAGISHKDGNFFLTWEHLIGSDDFKHEPEDFF